MRWDKGLATLCAASLIGASWAVAALVGAGERDVDILGLRSWREVDQQLVRQKQGVAERVFGRRFAVEAVDANDQRARWAGAAFCARVINAILDFGKTAGTGVFL